MSVDTYSICPCGNGKKIKFCKCKDSIHDMDRVMKMVEGGQLIPALDRLSTILEAHPDAAWALAIRGRLLIDLREYETLAENAERFIRLQPNNPLALTQRAAAQLFRGDVRQGTTSMLEALTESGREVDSFVLSVASVLAYTLLQTGAFLTARAYATLAMLATGYEGGSAAMDILQQLNGAPTIPSLLKAIPDPIERPAHADWGERFDEAQGLLRSNKIVLAQTKFESLKRITADEPSILSGLLTCAIWQGDVDKQSDVLRQLSESEKLDELRRVRFRAMSELVKPDMPGLSATVVSLIADVENVDEVDMALAADAQVLALPAEAISEMREDGEEVPPKAGFQLLDRDKPDRDAPTGADSIPRSLAVALLYGKQTDRDARLVVLDIHAERSETVRAKLESVLPNLTFGRGNDSQIPLIAVAQPQIAMLPFSGEATEIDTAINAMIRKELPTDLASVSLPLLDGKSLIDVADDDALKFQRQTVVAVIESYDALVAKRDDLVAAVCQIAKLDPPPMLSTSDDEVENVPNEDLNRLNLDGLSDDSLTYLMQRAQQVSATPLLRRAADKIIESQRAASEPTVSLIAQISLVLASTSQQEKIERLEAVKAFAQKHELMAPRLLFMELEIRLQARDGDGFQAALQQITGAYGQDPEVMSQLQQLLVSWGLVRPDGSPRAPGRSAPAAPPAAGAGELWTPDSASPSAAPAGGGEASGGSKLWVPGMD